MSEVIEKSQGVIQSPSDVHINGALTNVSVAYMQLASNFIADRVFPIVPVQKQSDLIWNFNPEQFNRDLMRKRAPATEAAIVGMVQSTLPYYAHVWAVGSDIADQTRGNADSPFELDRMHTEQLTNSALIRKEASFVSTFLQPGVWGTNLTGVTSSPGANQFLRWDNPASTPIEDIQAAKRAVGARTGIEPNKIVLGRKTYDDLVSHPDVLERVKYIGTPGAPARVTADALAALFELDEVLVSRSIVNSAAGGSVTNDTDYVFSDGALLVYTPRVANRLMPAAGLTFSWNGWMGATDAGFRVKKFRIEEREADRIEVQMAFDQRIIGAQLGVFFDKAVTPDA